MIFNIEKIQQDLDKFTQLQKEALTLALTTADKKHAEWKYSGIIYDLTRLLSLAKYVDSKDIDSGRNHFCGLGNNIARIDFMNVNHIDYIQSKVNNAAFVVHGLDKEPGLAFFYEDLSENEKESSAILSVMGLRYQDRVLYATLGNDLMRTLELALDSYYVSPEFTFRPVSIMLPQLKAGKRGTGIRNQEAIRDFVWEFMGKNIPRSDGFLQWEHPDFGNIYKLSQPNWWIDLLSFKYYVRENQKEIK